MSNATVPISLFNFVAFMSDLLVTTSWMFSQVLLLPFKHGRHLGINSNSCHVVFCNVKYTVRE